MQHPALIVLIRAQIGSFIDPGKDPVHRTLLRVRDRRLLHLVGGVLAAEQELSGQVDLLGLSGWQRW